MMSTSSDHILSKTVERIASRNCIPFCYLISQILKLKGVHPLEDKSPYLKPSPINIRTLNATSIDHTRKGVKQEGHAHHGGSCSSSHSYDEKLDNIIHPRPQHQDVQTCNYHALSPHQMWNEVHISPNSIGPNPKEARKRWGLVISWQKGGDGSW